MVALASTFLVLAMAFGALTIFVGVVTWIVLNSKDGEIWGFEVVQRDPYDLENWLQTIGLGCITLLLILTAIVVRFF